MKIKIFHLTIVGIIALIILILVLLSSVNTPTYANVTSPRPILGNPDANVKIVEFSDFQCPACKATSNYPQRLLNEYGNSISIEFKHFPLSFHNYAQKAAEAAECANDQGKFWEMADIMFANQQNLAVSDLKRYAKELELDTLLFSNCLDSGAKKDIVDKHLREGYSLNIPGTPTFIINGNMAQSIQYDAIKNMIDSELND